MDELERRERDLSRAVGRCIGDFDLIREGDRVMACLSGGKDSYTMLHLLERMRRKSPVKFEIVAVHLDQGHPGYDGTPLEGWLREHGYTHRIVREDTYSIVTDKLGPKDQEGGAPTYCSLCSRLRRGVLYNLAEELGCTRIALGHHRDDALETLMLNLMFTGSIKAMPAKLRSDDGRNVVIRPLLYCAEADIARFAEMMRFPILPCDLCGSQDELMRKEVKAMLVALEAKAPKVKESMLAAMGNVRATHLLDRDLWARLGIAPDGDEPKKSVALIAPDGKGRLPVVS
ncbi:MAG: tRNA 2-thiocytidine(32) synthetase TtcA [Sandaracinus sp.]